MGAYGREDYQTKYQVLDGYLRVYHGVTFNHILWETLVWIELLVKPKSEDVACRMPSLEHVKLEEIGVLKGVELKVTTSLNVYNRECLFRVLKEQEFKGPVEVEEENFTSEPEILGTLDLGKPVTISLERIKDKSSPLGFKAVLRLKHEDYELNLEPDIDLLIRGREIMLRRERMEWVKVKAEEWTKNVKVDGVNVKITLRLSRRGYTEHTLHVEAKATITLENVSEEKINRIVAHIEDLVKTLALEGKR